MKASVTCDWAGAVMQKPLAEYMCDGPTDRPTDRVTYRVACTRLKTDFIKGEVLKSYPVQLFFTRKKMRIPEKLTAPRLASPRSAAHYRFSVPGGWSGPYEVPGRGPNLRLAAPSCVVGERWLFRDVGLVVCHMQGAKVEPFSSTTLSTYIPTSAECFG